MVSIMVATAAPSVDRKCKRWGLPCPFCTQSAPYPSLVDSDWPGEDWDGDIEKRKTKKGRGDEAKSEKEEQEKILNYYPQSPIYDPY